MFVLTYWDGDRSYIVGVFSSREKAEQIKKQGEMMEKYSYVDFAIYSYPLDTHNL